MYIHTICNINILYEQQVVAIIQYNAGQFDPNVSLNCRVQSAVDENLQVEMPCIVLNYCYGCCSEMILLFI